MNCKEFWDLAHKNRHFVNWDYFNKTKNYLISNKFCNELNIGIDATDIHHLRDTEEQRKYNDEHYELWGHNLDGTFEYGKYVVFWTHEHHVKYHALSNETKSKISESNKRTWQESPDRRAYYSTRFSGEGNPFYGKHHTDETRACLSGENNGMYSKHHTEEAKRLISEANKGKIVSQETRDKLSKASSGEKNEMFGKHSDLHCADKVIELQKLASIVYKEYRSNGGTTKWQDFRRDFFKLNR